MKNWLISLFARIKILNVDGCSFEFDVDKQLLDKLDWEGTGREIFKNILNNASRNKWANVNKRKQSSNKPGTEYSNPLEEEGISSEFDSNLSSPTEWVKDWDNRVDWYA